MSSTHPRVKIGKVFLCHVERGGGVRAGAKRQDPVLCQALGNYPQMHVLFSHTKLWLIAMRLLKELWLPTERFTLIYITDC